MRNMLLIARREYLEQIRGRAFRLSTIGLPASVCRLLAIGYGHGAGIGGNKHIVVASANLASPADIASSWSPEGTQRRHRGDFLAPPEQRAALVQEIQDKLDGPVDRNSARWPPMATLLEIGRRLHYRFADQRRAGRWHCGREAGRRRNDRSAGPRIQSMASPSTYQVINRRRGHKEQCRSLVLEGLCMAFLLSLTTMIYGMNVARSIIQEKTSRIFEVMLATVEPSDMLAGKLIGVGAVGLTQIAIWLVAGVAIMASAFAAAILTGQPSIHFSWLEGVLFPSISF